MPPWLIGMMVGNMAGRIAFSRAIGLLLLWVVPPVALGNLAWQVMPLGAAKAVMAGTALTMLAYALWRPTSSRLKLALLDGIMIWARLAFLGCAIFLFWRFAFHDQSWRVLSDNGFAVATMVVTIILMAGLQAWVEADADRAVAHLNDPGPPTLPSSEHRP